MNVIIIGAGIGGLTLGLRLHQAGIPCRIYEAAPEIKPLGVGINLLPHATRELAGLGLVGALEAAGAVTTREITYFNRFGQLIYQEPSRKIWRVRQWPQFSIHRGDLQMVVLHRAFCRTCRGQPRDHQPSLHACKTKNRDGATAFFENPVTKEMLLPQRGDIVVSCEAAFIPSFASSFIQTKVRRAIRASTCGGV